MRISDWSSDVCSSDLHPPLPETRNPAEAGPLATAVSHPSASSDDADRAALLRALDRELDLPVDEREQGVVAAKADAHARMELGAALANDDVAGFDRLATIDLHAEILRVGAAAVARGKHGRAHVRTQVPNA